MDRSLVLIVDDHADLRETIAEILQLEGYQVVGVANGQEAFDYLDGHSLPGLILLDLKMPVMDGWEFRRRQLADPKYSKIPVAVISGADTTEQHTAGLEAVHYFVKPVNLPLLMEMLDHYCR